MSRNVPGVGTGDSGREGQGVKKHWLSLFLTLLCLLLLHWLFHIFSHTLPYADFLPPPSSLSLSLFSPLLPTCHADTHFDSILCVIIQRARTLQVFRLMVRLLNCFSVMTGGRITLLSDRTHLLRLLCSQTLNHHCN